MTTSQSGRGEGEGGEASTWPATAVLRGPLLKVNASAMARRTKSASGGEEVIMSHGAIRHSAVNAADSASARGEIYKSRCLLFIARARRPCLLSAI